jgi:hypothetical protein
MKSVAELEVQPLRHSFQGQACVAWRTLEQWGWIRGDAARVDGTMNRKDRWMHARTLADAQPRRIWLMTIAMPIIADSFSTSRPARTIWPLDHE